MLGTKTRRRQDGAAAVEFALVAPLLLMLLFGIISYGYMLSFRQAMSQGAAEAARAAVLDFDSNGAQTPEAAIDEAVSSYGRTCGSGALTCTVTEPSPCGSAGGGDAATGTAAAQCVWVTVRYDYAGDPLLPEFPGLGVVMPDTLEYVASARVS